MASKQRSGRTSNNSMIFSPWNYKVLALGILMVIAGFLAMYIENEVEGFISLYISPIVIMAGYVTVIVSILKHDDDTGSASDQS
jgi:uncharacterized membrane protein HdeD (DUF308 family)